MAIDFLILCLLIISLTVNLLALGAFWVTPGLRTTANRFVINLLIVNVISCIIITPTLFLRSSNLTGIYMNIEDIKKSHHHHNNNKNFENRQHHHYSLYNVNENRHIINNDTTTIVKDTILKCKNDICGDEKIVQHDNNINISKNNNNDEDETIIIAEMNLKENQNNKETEEDENFDEYQTENFNKIPTVTSSIKSSINSNGSSVSSSSSSSSITNTNKKFGVNNNVKTKPAGNKMSHGSSSKTGSSSDNNIRDSNNINDGIGKILDTPTVSLNPDNNMKLKSSEIAAAYSSMRISNNDSQFYYIDDRDIRCWTLDLVASLSALSVLLIVGDTWCAVTDPLRYHSRISALKAWIFIAFAWIFSILVGILSALRVTTITTITATEKFHGNDNSIYETTRFVEESLYNLIYSCFYFVLIILLPFGFVCAMYWRIFSEARENGLRMRQNGSSPLLQSALNLSGHHHHHHHHNNHSSFHQHHRHHQKEHSINGSQHNQNNNINHINNNNNTLSCLTLTKDLKDTNFGGLQMRIDNIKDGSTKPFLVPQNIIDTHDIAANQYHHHKDRNQNHIMLTLSAAQEDIKRNYSSRHLNILGSSQDLIDGHLHNGIRLVHSSPNLQKYQTNDMNNSSNNTDSSIMDNEQNVHHHHHTHGLQLPTILHTSPKALSYMTSIRHRLSNASSLFKYREESRAARISILVVIMFLVSYLPYGILVLLQGRVFQLSDHAKQLAIFVVVLGNLTSPIIFAYRNKRVRRGIKRLFNLDARAKDRQLQRRGMNSVSTNAVLQNNDNHDENLLTINNKSMKKTASAIAVHSNNTGKNNLTTYSLNTTCKLLTPNAANSFLVDLEHCHYIKNTFNKNNYKNNLTSKISTPSNATTNLNNGDIILKTTKTFSNDEEYVDDDNLSDNSIDNNNHENSFNSSAEKRSILKIVCDSSRKLGCVGGGGRQSCASSDCEIEPTDV